MCPSPDPAPDFVGRDVLLQDLARDPARVRVLVGVGGIGKTRLAQEHLARTPPALTLRCALGGARTRDDVEQVIAEALALPVDAARTRLGPALDSLGDCVLFVDEAEGCADALAQALPPLLAAAPRARALVTSRVTTGVPGERVFLVPPLGLDAAPDAPSEAERLLRARVRARRPDWRPEDDPRDATDALLRALEGVALAIELAAPRVAALGVGAVSSRLHALLPLLSDDAPGAPPRHRSLRATFVASWDLLPPAAQRVAARCGVFRGTFSLDDIEAVAPPDAADAAPVFAAVQALVEQNVLRHSAMERDRLDAFTFVRACLRERLDASGEAGDAEVRHTRRVLDEAARLRRALDLRDGDAAVRALLLWQDDLDAVLDRALARGDADDALAACLALKELRAPTDVLLERFDAAVALADRSGTAPSTLAAVLDARGVIQQRCGRSDDARADHGRSLTMAMARGDAPLVARARLHQAIVMGAAGDFARARDALTTLCDDPGAAADPRILGGVWSNLGNALCELDALDEAVRCYTRALVTLDAAGYRRLAAQTRGNLGVALLTLGRRAEARTVLADAQALYAAIPRRGLGGAVRCQLGMLDAAQGDLAAGAAHLAAGAATLHLAGNARAAAVFEVYLGGVRACLGDDRAAACLTEAEQQLRRIGNAPYAALAAGLLAAHAWAHGRDAEGAEHLARALGDRAARTGGSETLREVLTLLSTLPARRRGAPLPPQEPRDDDALELTLARRLCAGVTATEVPSPDAPPHDALVLSRRARWFRPPGRVRVNCARRRTAWLLLLALIDAHQRGVALPVAALLAAGWPGERMTPAVARNRLHVALNALRDLGLRAHLRRDEDGYALAPALSVVELDDDHTTTLRRGA
jgi:predicted ATPase